MSFEQRSKDPRDGRTSAAISQLPLPDNAVRCELCGGYFVSVANHLPRGHGITSREYRRRFPGALVVVPEISADEATRMLEKLGKPPTRPAPNAWVKAWERGDRLVDIARRHHVARAVVRARLRAAGASKRPTGRPFAREPRVCETCGAIFEAKRSEVARGGGSFCTRECWRARGWWRRPGGPRREL